MKLLFKILLGILLLPVLLIVILLLIYAIELALGYYPGYPGWEVGRIAAEKRDISICEKIILIPWIGFGPDPSSSKGMCRTEYEDIVKKSHDCITDFTGLDVNYCLEASQLHFNCYRNMEHVYICGPVPNGILLHDENCRDKNSKHYQNPYCILERVAHDEVENDCSTISDHIIRDECALAKAIKWKNTEECEEIRQPLLRSTCILGLKNE